MTINNKLLRALDRSEKAYALYLHNKKYFQALRIYNANKNIYELLNEYIYTCEEKDTPLVIEYIFHLEDWFNQFETEESTNLADVFVFHRLEGAISFPKNFKNIL
ncbi:hypothetical protein C1637_22260 [Chryseobacterium lactis]|uniref:Uncharacterized protein n=1 Tax=Chryseobacterium lactis TaxID=1241981 RepID=A0A3G6RTV3_CHRLC|nr:hypothetical protein [Chryseobacterium lactis]AZA85006.1 hypothetical protein EG342_25220 [Chryseobacterium lactis]AZB05394.1 hypothetical protein EG341_16100 [Chryseobacterium lactis]PNW11543.1 hypothetical protein C1637_22260 [Chryseobacterium lactis]